MKPRADPRDESFMTSSLPPELPMTYTAHGQLYRAATRHERIRAGLADHAIDSTLWIWLCLVIGWNLLHVTNSITVHALIPLLWHQSPLSMLTISSYLVFDLGLTLIRKRSPGQLLNRIQKLPQPPASAAVTGLRIWLHGLVSRCLGMPLLLVCLLGLAMINPDLAPIRLQDFSLIDPDGTLNLLLFLLEIIGMALLLFALFLPFGLAFLNGPLPTWYDRILGVYIVQATHSPQKPPRLPR